MESIKDTEFRYTYLENNKVKIDIYKNNNFTGSFKCLVMSRKTLDKLMK